MACAMRHLFKPPTLGATAQPPQLSSSPATFRPHAIINCKNRFPKYIDFSGHSSPTAVVSKASPGSGGIVAPDEDDGVSLGTMKLPLDTDFGRFETLLFQEKYRGADVFLRIRWANSLSQGANLPLSVPLKVDKIAGGARLGFIAIGDGQTEVFVYIDCLVFPATGGSGPIFRAIRNGTLKDRPAPDEPRIMRSLLAALKKSVELARA